MKVDLPRPTSRLLIYGGGALLLFLLGVLCGTQLLSGWLIATPTPVTLVVTATATSPLGVVATTTADGRLIDGRSCTVTPASWRPYTVQPGDTLSDLAQAVGLGPDIETLLRGNCLKSSNLLAGQIIYLPAPTPVPCTVSPPPNWGSYIVQENDTLFRLAADRRTDVQEVIRVNCLGSDIIQVGQLIYLPLLPTPTPSQTALPPPPLPSPTATPLPVVAVQAVSLPPLFQPGQSPLINPLSMVQLPLMGASSAQQSLAVAQISPFGGVGFFDDQRTAPGGPNALAPCGETHFNDPARVGVSIPGIDPPSGTITPTYQVHYGQRAQIFACNFKHPTSLSARLEQPDGQSRNLSASEGFYLPLQRGDTLDEAIRGAVTWNITCSLPLGRYTLTVKDRRDEITIYFDLARSDFEELLVAPQAAPIGSSFSVYYCGFPAQTEIPVALFRARLEGVEQQDWQWLLLNEWTIITNNHGWAVQTLTSWPNDPPGIYALRSDPFKGEDSFWLYRSR